MAHEIILPMLGMAQDTGIIIAWHKQIGDAVKASDILMEVETDKSTVEVEAGHDGYLVSLRAETGVPIPVGQVVAVISDNPDDVEAQTESTSSTIVEAKAETDSAPSAEIIEAAPAQETAKAPPSDPAPSIAAQPPRPSTSGRILASPKARNQAKERGIDLGRLVRLGVPQPFHVSDLDKAGSAPAFGASQVSYMRVVIEKSPFESFCSWLNEQADDPINSLNIWAAFTAGSWRKATGLSKDDEILVFASGFSDGADTMALDNPDQGNLSKMNVHAGGGEATVTILDLSDTPLAEYRPAGGTQYPHLTIANSDDGAFLSIAIAFDPDLLSEPAAYNFMKDLAERAQQPLRHLL